MWTSSAAVVQFSHKKTDRRDPYLSVALQSEVHINHLKALAKKRMTASKEELYKGAFSTVSDFASVQSPGGVECNSFVMNKKTSVLHSTIKK